MKKLLYYFSVLTGLIHSLTTHAQWTQQVSGTTQNLNSIVATSNLSVFTVGANGTGRKTTDGGLSWNTMGLGITTTQNSIRFLNSLSGFTAGGFQDILKTTNGGSSWTNIGGGITDLNDCYFTSSSSGWVAGNIEVGYGFLYNPFTFNLIQIPANANKVLRGIYFANSTNGWVVGDGGLIIKTINNGSSWTQQTSGSTNQLNKIMFIDTNNGIAVGNGGTILKTINGGTTWTSSVSGTVQNLNAVYYADTSNIWVCGNNGILLKSSDGGLAWTPEISGTTAMLNAIHGTGITDIWACGNNGTIIYRPGTTSLFEIQSPPHISVYPNPSRYITTITFENSLNKNCTLSIFDSQGQLVRKIDNITKDKVEIERNDMTPGIYFFIIKNEMDTLSGMFVLN